MRSRTMRGGGFRTCSSHDVTRACEVHGQQVKSNLPCLRLLTHFKMLHINRHWRCPKELHLIRQLRSCWCPRCCEVFFLPWREIFALWNTKIDWRDVRWMRWVTGLHHVEICREVFLCHSRMNLPIELCGTLCSDCPLSQVFMKNMTNYTMVDRHLLLHLFQGHSPFCSHHQFINFSNCFQISRSWHAQSIFSVSHLISVMTILKFTYLLIKEIMFCSKESLF